MTQTTQNEETNTKYFVYIRDMMDYEEHSFGFLQEQKNGTKCFWVALNCCDTLSSAEEWVIKHGKIYTDDYYENYGRYAVIKIVEQEIGCYIEDIFCEVYGNVTSIKDTYCFSEGSYKMLCSEIFILSKELYCEIDAIGDFTYVKDEQYINTLPSELIEVFDRYIKTRKYDRAQLEKLLLSHL